MTDVPARYAIIHMSGDKITKEIPLIVSYGLVQAFDSQRGAYLHAQKVFGSKFDVMKVRIVPLLDAIKCLAVRCEVRSGYYKIKDGKYVIDKDRPRYKDLYPSFVDGYKRTLRCRRESRARELARVAAAKARKFNAVKAEEANGIGTPVTASKGMTDKELRLAIYKETGKYTKPVKPMKPLEDEFV